MTEPEVLSDLEAFLRDEIRRSLWRSEQRFFGHPREFVLVRGALPDRRAEAAKDAASTKQPQ